MEDLYLAEDYITEAKTALDKVSFLVYGINNQYDFVNEPSCNRINLSQDSIKWLMGYKALMTTIDMIDEYVVKGNQFLQEAEKLLSAVKKSLNQVGKKSGYMSTELTPVEKAEEAREFINPKYAAEIDDLISIIEHNKEPYAIANTSFNYGYYQGFTAEKAGE